MNDITAKMLIGRSARLVESVAKAQSITADIRRNAVDLFVELDQFIKGHEEYDISSRTLAEVIRSFDKDSWLQAIKVIREDTGYGLKDGKDLAGKIAINLGYEEMARRCGSLEDSNA